MVRSFGLVAIAVILAGCATQPSVSAYSAPGFIMGFIHGFISPFALIAGFFTPTRVYAFPNTGWFYDLGFMIGISSLGGGAASTR